MVSAARRATPADLDAAAAVLGDAFADYPALRWTVAADRHTWRIEQLQRLWMERAGIPYGEVWVIDDADGRIASVAIWNIPGVVIPPAVFAAMEPLQVEFEGDRHEQSVAADAAISGLHPETPHYYLGALGTRRAVQGQGLARAALAPVLARADNERMDACLETSSLENVRFYERLGFAVTGKAEMPGGGPPVWAMLRRPRP